MGVNMIEEIIDNKYNLLSKVDLSTYRKKES